MISNFTDVGIPEIIARAMADMGWNEPTPIQVASIEDGMAGRDLIAQAQTGTGKTGAFGSVVISRIPAKSKLPSAIILLPTRELALQAYGEMSKLSKYTGHVCVPVYGGKGAKADIDYQIKEISKGADIIAGTPGRVKDLMKQGALNLAEIKVLVLDEADRMLEMGFIEDLEDIMRPMPKDRQTLLFSATMDENVKQLAYAYTNDAKEITVSQDEIVLDLTKQYYISVGRRNKSWALCQILDIMKPKAIIFCQTIKMVDLLEERLEKFDYKLEAIHGSLPQSKRERVINDLRNDKIDILIATDVAARGIDIEDITCVINYDMPESVDTYIHRIGRTGRAGKEGTAISFVTSGEEHLVTEFQRRVDMVIEKMAVPEDPDIKPRIKKVVDYDQISDPFGMAKFKVNLGKGDGYNRVSLADFIIRNARVRDVAIGKIDMSEDSSIVEVHRDFANRMTMDLTKCKHKGKHITVKVNEE
jgi:ATP-dependent RNA helicase DeaD